MGVATGKLTPCPRCRARGRDKKGDNLVHYTNGSTHCFSCGYNTGDLIEEHEDGPMEFDNVARLPVLALGVRGISAHIAGQFGVRCEVDGETGQPVAAYYPLYRGAELCGYQRKVVRLPGERQKTDVSRVGETKGCDPFGSRRGGSGKMVVVCEGAEDAMAMAQMLAEKGKRYHVVSTLGTDGWKRTIGYFTRFAKVVIAYDMDDAGQDAAREFAAALSPGQAYLAQWSGANDPNELLTEWADGADRALTAIYDAQTIEPSGLITGEEVWETMQSYIAPASVPFPPEWEDFNLRTEGIREAEISILTGGSTVGKTAYARKIKHHILTATNWRLGEVELEEQKTKTWRGLMECELRKGWAKATPEERRAAFEATYGTKRIITLDHRSQFGRGQSLISRFKHLHYGMGCKFIMLDHITLAVNEFGDGQGNQAQDQMMNEFLEFVETTGCHLFLLCHLRKSAASGGKSFEEGAIPSMDDLKGSGSLKQVAFNIYGVSRDTMNADPYIQNVSQLHVLKCRETGKSGHSDRQYWENESRSLTKAREVAQPDEDDEF